MSKRKRQSKGPYVAVPKRIMETPAWRAMSPEGRLLWVDLRGWLRNDGLNNGKVHRSCRAAADALGLSKNTVARRFAELEHYGFLRKTAPGFLGSDGRGIAAKYQFTDLAHGTHPPTRDYEKWDGELFAYTPRRASRKKQNPVPPRGTPRTTAWDIRKGLKGVSVCTTAWDIGEGPGCTTAWDISRLPLPSEHLSAVDLPLAGPAEPPKQGSSTVRAPASAGGAGSSPAPVTNVIRPPLPLRPKPLLPWSTPTLVEVTDPAEKMALRAAAEGVTADVPAENGGYPPPSWQLPCDLSSRRVRELTEWRSEQAYWNYTPTEIAAGKLDAALRAVLAKEVPAECVETEFGRVMKLVHSS
jgi:hypothetical protein